MSTANDDNTAPMPPVVESNGQERSQERGSATVGKKNPGKRPSQSGN